MLKSTFGLQSKGRRLKSGAHNPGDRLVGFVALAPCARFVLLQSFAEFRPLVCVMTLGDRDREDNRCNSAGSHKACQQLRIRITSPL